MRDNSSKDRSVTITIGASMAAAFAIYQVVRSGIVTHAIAQDPYSEDAQIFQHEGGKASMIISALITAVIANYCAKEEDRLPLLGAALLGSMGDFAIASIDDLHDQVFNWSDYILSGGRDENVAENIKSGYEL